MGSVQPILRHLLEGQNASILAYGPTGAGELKVEQIDETGSVELGGYGREYNGFKFFSLSSPISLQARHIQCWGLQISLGSSLEPFEMSYK